MSVCGWYGGLTRCLFQFVAYFLTDKKTEKWRREKRAKKGLTKKEIALEKWWRDSITDVNSERRVKWKIKVWKVIIWYLKKKIKKLGDRSERDRENPRRYKPINRTVDTISVTLINSSLYACDILSSSYQSYHRTSHSTGRKLCRLCVYVCVWLRVCVRATVFKSLVW